MLVPVDTTQEVVGVWRNDLVFNFAFLSKMIRRVICESCRASGANQMPDINRRPDCVLVHAFFHAYTKADRK